jgi:uracil-DNA glycosylase
LARLRGDPEAAEWCRLPFFATGEADRIAAELDRAIAAGVEIAPSPADIFTALTLTPRTSVKAVILGQDPYPKRGDAHGLAFSYVGPKSVPQSLRVILKEFCEDLALQAPTSGNLSAWGRQGAHMKLGWSALTDEVVSLLSAGPAPVAFLLWGADARRRAALIDRSKHLVLESGHPSPLNRARDFPGSRPFSRANAWLMSRGLEPVDWRL